jgi:hypothetical protein
MPKKLLIYIPGWLYIVDSPLKVLVLGASAKNNSTSCLSFGPSSALHPPAHISICADECALMTNQNPSPYCGIISYRDPCLNVASGQSGAPIFQGSTAVGAPLHLRANDGSQKRILLIPFEAIFRYLGEPLWR